MTNPLFAEFEKEIAENDIVVYMKGDQRVPMCGFSATVVAVFQRLGAKFYDVNVLASNEVREGIKQFSDWPTLPQVYIKGEFIGGCDIIREMYENGELAALLKEKGIATAA